MHNIIVAADENGVIGNQGGMPWNLPDDLKRFKSLTEGHTVIMGRKTFESIGSKPLPDRRNIVITSKQIMNVSTYESIQQMFDEEDADSVFFIGGVGIFEEALKIGIVDTIYLTRVLNKYEGDTFFKFDESEWVLNDRMYRDKGSKNSDDFQFEEWKKLSTVQQ